MRKNNKKGFTLVELVIVVAVMAVLVAVAIPTVGSIVDTAEEAVADSNARTIESVIKLAQAKVESGTTALSNDQIAAAVNGASLGIETGDFYYNPTTGAVSAETNDVSGTVKITFADFVATAGAAS